jgi:hypothetical protein|tara:strand:- start:506 stop:733 length:228 start_codon:yes stop_codon:yes gene_type:complete
MIGLFKKPKQDYKLIMVKQEYTVYLTDWIGKLEKKINMMESRGASRNELQKLQNNLRILKTCAKTFKGISAKYEQ